MTVFLVVVSLYGGIATLPMNSLEICETAAGKFNSPASRSARAYCIANSPQ